MRQEPFEAHGSMYPADAALLEAVNAVFRDWSLAESAHLEGDILQIAFEGVCFPLDDMMTVIQSHIGSESAGRIDVFDLEAWRMTRVRVTGREIGVSSSDLNAVLAYSGF